MATEILRPQDCLRRDHFYDPFSPPKPIPNRRRSRPAKASVSPPNSSSKHGCRPNPKSARKGSPSSSSSSSSSSPSSSPPSTSPLSASPVHEGFRLLKRGEQFRPVAAAAAAQSGSEKKSPVESSSSKHKKHELSTDASVVPPLTEKVPVLRKTPPQKKPQSDRVNKPDRLKSPSKPLRFGSDRDSCFAGPNFAIRAPEASCLPQPGFLLRSSSVGGPTSDDEASRALRSLLKLQFL